VLFLYILLRKTQKKGVKLFSSEEAQTKKKKKKKKRKKKLTHKQKGKEAKQLFEGEILSDISSFTHTHTHSYSSSCRHHCSRTW